ncbi:MAG: carotenoid oxygenase family protein [Deltaproteobacteria bacterium]|nr:carotenoid oxygenase family protein [Deltaproteobacteria bacterium]
MCRTSVISATATARMRRRLRRRRHHELGSPNRVRPRDVSARLSCPRLEALHLFDGDGDGLVQAFRFEAGRAWVQSAFVRNASFLAEEAEGRFCMNALAAPPRAPGLPRQLRRWGRVSC